MVQKLWAVGAKHKQARMPDPFRNNSLLRSIIANNTALDDPSLPKVPLTKFHTEGDQKESATAHETRFRAVGWHTVRDCLSLQDFRVGSQ